MWWVLLSVALLVIFENFSSVRAGLPYLLNPKTYFWLFLNVIVLSSVVSVLLPAIAGLFDRLNVHGLADLKPYPLFAQFIVLLIVLDFVKFGIHCFMHRNTFLWKIHSVHHSSLEINTLASFKHSWLEAFLNLLLISFVSRILTVELPVLVTINTIMLSACIWQHTKIRYYSVPVLDEILVTPKHHRIHHEFRDDPQHSNYGLLFTLWDRLFGTFSKTENPTSKYGIAEPDYPFDSNVKQFFYPLIK